MFPKGGRSRVNQSGLLDYRLTYVLSIYYNHPTAANDALMKEIIGVLGCYLTGKHSE